MNNHDLLLRATLLDEPLPPAEYDLADIIRAGRARRRRRRTVHAAVVTGTAAVVTATAFALPAITAQDSAPSRLVTRPAVSLAPGDAGAPGAFPFTVAARPGWAGPGDAPYLSCAVTFSFHAADIPVPVCPLDVGYPPASITGVTASEGVLRGDHITSSDREVLLGDAPAGTASVLATDATDGSSLTATLQDSPVDGSVAFAIAVPRDPDLPDAGLVRDVVAVAVDGTRTALGQGWVGVDPAPNLGDPLGSVPITVTTGLRPGGSGADRCYLQVVETDGAAGPDLPCFPPTPRTEGAITTTLGSMVMSSRPTTAGIRVGTFAGLAPASTVGVTATDGYGRALTGTLAPSPLGGGEQIYEIRAADAIHSLRLIAADGSSQAVPGARLLGGSQTVGAPDSRSDH